MSRAIKQQAPFVNLEVTNKLLATNDTGYDITMYRGEGGVDR